MEQNHIIYAFDLGTKTFNAIAAEYNERENFCLHIIDKQSTAAVGIRRGRIDNPESVARNVNTIIQTFEKKLTQKSAKRYYCFSLNGLSYICENRKISSTISQSNPIEITDNHIYNMTEKAKSTFSINNNMTILNIRPISYSLDFSNTVYDIKNKSCKSIESDMLLISAQNSDLGLLTRVCEIFRNSAKTDYDIKFVPISIAKSITLLSPEDTRNGAILVDFGAQTSSVAIYKKGILSHIASIPFGSDSLTSDLTKVLDIAPNNAEILKQCIDIADNNLIDSNLNIEFNDKEKFCCPYNKIRFIIEARLGEIFAYIDSTIEKSRSRKDIKKVIFTGNGSKLKGLKKFADIFLDNDCTIINDTEACKYSGAIGVAASFVRDNRDLFIVKEPTLFPESEQQPKTDTPQQPETTDKKDKKKWFNAIINAFDSSEKNINE